MNSYTQNSTVRLSVAITNTTTNTPVDPTAVTLKVELPDGTILDISSTLQHPSAGNYYADYIPVVVGVYRYEFLGSGSAVVSSVGMFNVDQATF
jgi:hypothetical protein